MCKLLQVNAELFVGQLEWAMRYNWEIISKCSECEHFYMKV